MFILSTNILIFKKIQIQLILSLHTSFSIPSSIIHTNYSGILIKQQGNLVYRRIKNNLICFQIMYLNHLWIAAYLPQKIIFRIYILLCFFFFISTIFFRYQTFLINKSISFDLVQWEYRLIHCLFEFPLVPQQLAFYYCKIIYLNYSVIYREIFSRKIS